MVGGEGGGGTRPWWLVVKGGGGDEALVVGGEGGGGGSAAEGTSKRPERGRRCAAKGPLPSAWGWGVQGHGQGSLPIQNRSTTTEVTAVVSPRETTWGCSREKKKSEMEERPTDVTGHCHGPRKAMRRCRTEGVRRFP